MMSLSQIERLTSRGIGVHHVTVCVWIGYTEALILLLLNDLSALWHVCRNLGQEKSPYSSRKQPI